MPVMDGYTATRKIREWESVSANADSDVWGTEDRGQRAESTSGNAEWGTRKSEVGMRNAETEVRGQNLEDRDQKPETRSQASNLQPQSSMERIPMDFQLSAFSLQHERCEFLSSP